MVMVKHVSNDTKLTTKVTASRIPRRRSTKKTLNQGQIWMQKLEQQKQSPTGRVAVKYPDIQSLAKRTNEGQSIREAFMAQKEQNG